MSDQSPRLRRPLTFLFLGSLLLLAAVWGSRPLVHDDLFFHLATGQYVSEHLQVPTTDLFSFTRYGEPWVSHEWGFGLLSYFFWLTAGYEGLVALKVFAVVTILLLLLALICRASESSLTSPGVGPVVLLAVGLWAVNEQLILRASLFSSLFFLLLLHLLYWFDRMGSRLAAVAIGGLFLLWGNFHSEVVFGLFLLGVLTIESLLGRWVDPRYSVRTTLLQVTASRPYPTLFTVSLLLALVNPNGVHALLYPFRLAWFLLSSGDVLYTGHFMGATLAANPAFFLLIAILFFGLLSSQRLRTLSLTQFITVGVFLLLSIRSHRFIFFFTLLALPVIGRLFCEPRESSLALLRSPRIHTAVAGLGSLVVAAASVTAWSNHASVPISRHFPAGAVRFLQAEKVEGRFFHHQNYGGYLHWNLGTPIFWDGRNLLFASLMEEVRRSNLETEADRWQLEYLVLTGFEYRVLRRQLVSSKWGLAYWDDFAAVYLRRGHRYDELLERFEFSRLPPFGGIKGLRLLIQNPAWAKSARLELDQVLQFTPDCRRALYLRALISRHEGHQNRAEGELREALKP